MLRKPRRNPQGQRSNARLGARHPTAPASALDLAALERRRLYLAKLPAVALLVGSFWLLATLFGDVRFQISEVIVEASAPASQGMSQAVWGESAQPIPLRIARVEDIQRVVNVTGSNIFRLNSEETAANLKREFGCLEKVVVYPRLPDQVLVKVQEYGTVLVWESGGQSWWVSVQGDLLGPATNTADLVVIRDIGGHGLGGADSAQGGYIAGVPWDLAQKMVKALPAIHTLDYTENEGLILYVTTAQWPVYLGYKGDAQAKAQVMQALVTELMAKKFDVEYIDLRDERRPSFKKR